MPKEPWLGDKFPAKIWQITGTGFNWVLLTSTWAHSQNFVLVLTFGNENLVHAREQELYMYMGVWKKNMNLYY